MSEPTLALPLTKLEAHAGDHLGYGRGANFSETTWTARQQRAITECVDSGLRMFYYPSPLPGESTGYDWSFLRPFTSKLFASGSFKLALDDDFGGMEGGLRTFGADQGALDVKQAPEALVRRFYEETPDKTGRPECFAVQALKVVPGVGGQRFQFHIFPVADQDYTLEFQYYLNPSSLTAANPYAYGGAQHAETVLAAVKAAAEQHRNGQRGVEYVYFQERLAASVSNDRRQKAQYLGYNSDPSYNRGRPIVGGRHFIQAPAAITWDGT